MKLIVSFFYSLFPSFQQPPLYIKGENATCQPVTSLVPFPRHPFANQCPGDAWVWKRLCGRSCIPPGPLPPARTSFPPGAGLPWVGTGQLPTQFSNPSTPPLGSPSWLSPGPLPSDPMALFFALLCHSVLKLSVLLVTTIRLSGFFQLGPSMPSRGPNAAVGLNKHEASEGRQLQCYGNQRSNRLIFLGGSEEAWRLRKDLGGWVELGAKAFQT